MYNPLKNKIDTFFFNNHVSTSYEKIVEIENEEEAYLKKTKLAVVVNNEEVGKRLYDIITSLKQRGTIIQTSNAMLRITKYISDKEDTIKVFYINFALKDKLWSDFTEIDKLKELVSFVDAMKNMGYIIDTSIFNYKKCDQIAALFSFFKPIGEEVEDKNECIIEYIHYILSRGEDLNQYFENAISKGIIDVTNLSYNMSAIKMFYEYYKTKTYTEDILTVLNYESYESNFSHFHYKYYGIESFRNCGYLLLDKDIFKSNAKVIEENDKYVIYDNNIKIYCEAMPAEFSDFVFGLEENQYQYISETIGDFVCDLDYNVVGYVIQKVQNSKLLSKQIFNKQATIIELMQKFRMFSENVSILSTKYNLQPRENDFEIEKTLIYDGNFYFRELIDLFNYASGEKEKIKIQIIKLFFKLFNNYIKSNYGEIDNEDNFFQIDEIKYLSPILVRELINYSLGREVNYDVAYETLEWIISSRKLKLTTNNSQSFYYDFRFIYNPRDVSYLFDYEIEKEYGVKVNQDIMKTTKKLKDGSKLVIFPSNSETVASIEYSESCIRNDIWKYFKDFHVNVNISGIKQIIYKKNITNGFYEFIGYVTKPIKGKKLTDDFLLSLSNKDFLMVAGELFTAFDIYSIPLEVIYMDKDYKFYIDIRDKNFKIKYSECYGRGRRGESQTYIYWIINRLMKHPKCSINTFVDFPSIDSLKYKAPSKNTLIRIANSLDTYCEEHNVYFDSFNKMCPVCLKTKHFIETNELTDIVFEDEYAKHYSLNSNFNVKIYKKSNVDIAVLEEKVEKMICMPNVADTQLSYYHQECFIPYKKAIDSNNEFVGYIYKAVDFNNKTGDHSCINLKDSEYMSNLPRIKSLVRLISQVLDIRSEGKGFINNPFENVFLIKAYKKQVQIVNIEFISIGANEDNTLDWLNEYVCNVIKLDPNIDLDVSNNDLIYTTYQKLKNLSQKLTKYCSYHNFYYDTEYLFCPKCVPDVKNKNYQIEMVHTSEITSLEQINEGGESFIYNYFESVIKVFKEEAINFNLKNRIMARLLNKKDILNEINKHNEENGIKFRYIIPNKMFVDKNSNSLFAYAMDKVEGKPISALRDKAQVEQLGFSRKDVLEILITVGEGIETLHKKANMYIGDLNGRNILFDKNKMVYFLDFDGMGIDDIAPEFCTDGYIDPVSKKNNNITMKDDWYSFAVQAFYYLTYTHPFNGIYYSYSVENDKKITLDIPEKMEKRISLLGNHGMEAPSVAVPWNDWMNENLKKAFLTIFEGSNRKSIVPLLKEQYNQLYRTSFEEAQQQQEIKEESVRVNSKFIANKLPIFNDEVIKVINHNCAICKDRNDKHYLLGKDGEFSVYSGIFEFYENIVDIMISDDKKLAFVILQKSIKVINIQDSTFVCTKTISDPNNVVLNGSTLYFSFENIIYELTFDSCVLVKEQKIKFLTEYEMKRFYVQSNSKFVQVKRNVSEKVDGIYCNSELLCNIHYTSEETNYNIIYDEISKLWLVINTEGNVVSINSRNGSYEQVQISNIDGYNIENITFYNGRIYIPEVGGLYIVNVNNQYTTKKMECHVIMTPDSKVCGVNNNGFNVLANNNIYEVCRG